MHRVGNSAIMDLVMTSGRFTSAEVKKLIYCRVYLKAITLSDLTTIRGDCLGMVKTEGASHSHLARQLVLFSSRTTLIKRIMDTLLGAR